MKKFLFVALGALFALAMYAAQPADVGKPMSDQVLLVQADAQTMVADFVYVDYSIETIATASGTSYELYQAMPAEVRNQVFDLKMPVFRLCRWTMWRSIVRLRIRNWHAVIYLRIVECSHARTAIINTE